VRLEIENCATGILQSLKATVEVARLSVEVFQLTAKLPELGQKAGIVAEKVTDGIEI
jgi:hypothetical protein